MQSSWDKVNQQKNIAGALQLMHSQYRKPRIQDILRKIEKGKSAYMTEKEEDVSRSKI